MKKKHIAEGCTSTWPRAIALSASLVLLVPGSASAGSDLSKEPIPEPEPEEESLANWVDVVVGGAFIDGSDAAFKRRFGGPDNNVFGGIEDFHYETFTDNGLFSLDGHALFGLEDYDLRLRYDRDDIGFVRGGFRQFRTWYDGSAGYAPQVEPPQDWYEPLNDEMHLDRGEVWFEAGLRKPEAPQLTFGYWHRWRDGQKDSTIWGRDSRGNIPSWYDIDETTDIFRLDALHTLLGKGAETTLGGGLAYHRIRNDDSRHEFQGRGAEDPEDDRKVTQQDIYESDYYNAHLYSESRFGEKMLLSFGYSFTSMDTNIGGDRTSYDRNGDLRTSSDHSYFDLMGGSQSTINILNGNFWWNPLEDWVFVPSIRAEFWDQSAIGNHIAGIRGRPDGTLEDVTDSSDYQWNKFTEQLEIRYSGLSNVLFYGNAQLSQTDGDMSRSTVTDFEGDIETASRSNDSDIDQQKYTIGANWYPLRGVSLSGQYYYRSYDQDFTNHVLVDDDAQLREHKSATNDVNLRLTWRAMPNLTLVSRYDFQQSDIKNRAFSGLPNSTDVTDQVTSGDITKHIFSQSVTWVPREWMYLQGSFHWIDSMTDTPANDLDGVDSGYIPDWSNDYWMLSLNAGFSLDDRTDLQAGYFYYDASSSDNFVDNSDISTPYGTLAKEHALTLRLTQRITPAMSWNVGYGYFRSDDDAYGGHRDYNAHVVSSGFRYRF